MTISDFKNVWYVGVREYYEKVGAGCFVTAPDGSCRVHIGTSLGGEWSEIGGDCW